jgi:hypothetical protein
VSFLPKIFLLTSFMMMIFTFALASLFYTQFMGIFSETCIYQTDTVFGPQTPTAYINFLTLLVMWGGIGGIMKLIHPKSINYTNYLIISGIKMVYIMAMVIILGAWTFFFIYHPLSNYVMATSSSIFTNELITEVIVNAVFSVIYYGPINLAFFGFIIFTGLSISYTQPMNTQVFWTNYLLINIIIISLMIIFVPLSACHTV